MAYCRWSSQDFACDLYAYESDAGYTIHVASYRVVGDVPPLSWEFEDRDAWFDAYRAQHEFLAEAAHEPIGLPYDGDTFVFDTLEEFGACFRMLREAGYRFPDAVFALIAEERRDAS